VFECDCQPNECCACKLSFVLCFKLNNQSRERERERGGRGGVVEEKEGEGGGVDC
jgi:hypothetical protein